MKPNILIVDDSPAMRRFIGRVLDATSLEPGQRREAANGREAMHVLAEEAGSPDGIDLVLADVNMPVMDGPSLVREMHNDPRLKRLPVLVVSTDRSEARIAEMEALGIAGYVTKPFTPEQLEEKIVAALDRAGAAEDHGSPAHAKGAHGTQDEVVAGAIEEILESMCFLYASPVEAEQATNSLQVSGLLAEVSFSGPFCGRLRLRVDLGSLRAMAANFLGEEEDTVTALERETVLLELANMICGALLHEQDDARLFTLGCPSLVTEEGSEEQADAWHYFTVADGYLAALFSITPKRVD